MNKKTELSEWDECFLLTSVVHFLVYLFVNPTIWYWYGIIVAYILFIILGSIFRR